MAETVKQNKRGKVYFTENDMLYLPAIADKCNYDVRINPYTSSEQILNDILEYPPNYLVSKIRFETYKYQMDFLLRVKEMSPTTKIIVTGEPFLTYNTNVTYENPFISYAIMGEPEYTLHDILDGVPDNEILGICYTDDNMQAIKNEQRPFIENLDELPFPLRDKNKSFYELEISRGCPHHCFFCMVTPIKGNKVRYRSPESIISEIEECITKYNVTNFIFKADNFNADVNFVNELCVKIIENKLKIKWSADVTPKNIDDSLAEVMSKSGCVSCNVGVESGSLNILKNIEKNISVNDIKTTVANLKKHKIKVVCRYLFGLPWETEETAEETIKLSLELNSDEAVYNIASPYPGTKFFVYSMINRLTSGEINFDKANVEPIVRTHKLSKEKILEIQNRAIKRYYAQPKFILDCILNFNFKLLFKTEKNIFTDLKINNKRLKENTIE